MFLNLFFKLKEAKVPVSLREHLTLIEAMEKGLVIYDVEEFYFLSRSALIKDERHLDRFDRVFAEVFKGLETVSSPLKTSAKTRSKRARWRSSLTSAERARK